GWRLRGDRRLRRHPLRRLLLRPLPVGGRRVRQREVRAGGAARSGVGSPAMDDATLAARQLAGQMAAFEHNVGSAGQVLRPAPGVLATLVAAVPERSLPNSVVYTDATVLTDAVLDELQARYDEA